MGINSAQSIFRRRSAPPQTAIAPFYGVGPKVTPANKNAALILALPSRGPTAGRECPPFTLDSRNNSETMYYAYPKSYGQATFTDTSSGYQGGWDGARGDFGQTLGPIEVTVTINSVPIVFYLYETDYPNLGSVEWSVS